MNPSIYTVFSRLVERVVAVQRESQEVIEQLHVVNHEVHSFSSLDMLHEAIEATEVQRLHQLAEYASDLTDELCSRNPRAPGRRGGRGALKQQSSQVKLLGQFYRAVKQVQGH